MALETPKINPKAQARSVAAINWEEPVCPPNCHINHDKKWWGVTVPMPKMQPKPRIPRILAINYEGAPEPTRKTLARHQNIFGDSPELHEVAALYGIDLSRKKEGKSA